jgi:hypothetical protein
MTYQLLANNDQAVIKDGYLCIPFAPDNTDYQAYLKWVAEGNTPLPAEEV